MPTRGASTQENITPAPASSSMDAKIDQLMDMMRGLTTRMDALEAKSRSTTSTLPASTTSAPPAPQPQPQPQSQSTLSIAQPVSQQKKKRNEKTRQQYKRRTLQQANTKQEQEKEPAQQAFAEKTTENTAEKESISSGSSKANSIKTTGLLSAIPGITSWFLQHHHYIMLVSPLAYIRFAEDMEVTGQG